METICRTEITELHHFFVEWMTGALPRTAEAFARAADVLADDMTMINPEGEVMACAALLGAIETAHGAFTPPEQTFRIWIKNYDCRFVSGDLCLATYEEWQDRTGEVKGRLSTVLFRRRDGLPNGVEWLHVHETWLPGGSSP